MWFHIQVSTAIVSVCEGPTSIKLWVPLRSGTSAKKRVENVKNHQQDNYRRWVKRSAAFWMAGSFNVGSKSTVRVGWSELHMLVGWSVLLAAFLSLVFCVTDFLCNGHWCIPCCEMQYLHWKIWHYSKSSWTSLFFVTVLSSPSFIQHLAEFAICKGCTLGLCSFVLFSSLLFLAGFIFPFLPRFRLCVFRLLSFACDPICFPYSWDALGASHACLLALLFLLIIHTIAFDLFRMYLL